MKIEKFIDLLKDNLMLCNEYDKNRVLIDYDKVVTMPSFNERSVEMLDKFNKQIEMILIRKPYPIFPVNEIINSCYKENIEKETEK